MSPVRPALEGILNTILVMIAAWAAGILISSRLVVNVLDALKDVIAMILVVFLTSAVDGDALSDGLPRTGGLLRLLSRGQECDGALRPASPQADLPEHACLLIVTQRPANPAVATCRRWK